MNCADPFVRAGEAYACGRCLPCRRYQSRIWFHRVMLEATQHDYNSAVTLTYDQAALPTSGELQPEHLRNWIKRYRKRALERYPWRRLRFFACAEYGEGSARPHYHLVLFGQPSCDFGRGGRLWCGDCQCVTCCDVSETWGLGASSIEALDQKTAAYICGYVTRKLTSPYRGKGLKPFLRMSNRPGLGAAAMDDVASEALKLDLDTTGLPTRLRMAGRTMVLGRYLRKKLHDKCGLEVPAPEKTPAMSAVFEYAFSRSISAKTVLTEINAPYASQLAQAEAVKRKGPL